MRRILASFLLLGLLAGCAGQPDDPPNPTAPQPGEEGDPAALRLVNLWRVSGATGESEDTWLRLDGGEFQLWRECGMLFGSWVASETLFLASAYGAREGCSTDLGIPSIPWLEAAVGYSADATSRRLLDTDGEAVATLTVDGAPRPIATAAEFYTRPPEITDELRARLRDPLPLPPGQPAASVKSLPGRWVPAGFTGATDPHVEFAADGSWSASDGCNRTAGRWATDGSGLFLSTGGMITEIGCEGVFVPGMVWAAKSAGVDGESLVLFDADAAELGRFVRG